MNQCANPMSKAPCERSNHGKFTDLLNAYDPYLATILANLRTSSEETVIRVIMKWIAVNPEERDIAGDTYIVMAQASMRQMIVVDDAVLDLANQVRPRGALPCSWTPPQGIYAMTDALLFISCDPISQHHFFVYMTKHDGVMRLYTGAVNQVHDCVDFPRVVYSLLWLMAEGIGLDSRTVTNKSASKQAVKSTQSHYRYIHLSRAGITRVDAINKVKNMVSVFRVPMWWVRPFLRERLGRIEYIEGHWATRRRELTGKELPIKLVA